MAPFPALDQLDDGLKRRRTLDDLLGLRVSATTSFRIAAAILSPLLGSVAGILPKLGG